MISTGAYPDRTTTHSPSAKAYLQRPSFVTNMKLARDLDLIEE
jgi:hypothetical protein